MIYAALWIASALFALLLWKKMLRPALRNRWLELLDAIRGSNAAIESRNLYIDTLEKTLARLNESHFPGMTHDDILEWKTMKLSQKTQNESYATSKIRTSR